MRRSRTACSTTSPAGALRSTTTARPRPSGAAISRGARKHGISESDIRGVLATPLRTIVQGERVLLIGLASNRDLLGTNVGTPRYYVGCATILRCAGSRSAASSSGEATKLGQGQITAVAVQQEGPYRPERSTPITELTTIGDPETKNSTREPKCATTAHGLENQTAADQVNGYQTLASLPS